MKRTINILYIFTMMLVEGLALSGCNNARQKQLDTTQSFTANGVEFKVAMVEAGTFRMGYEGTDTSKCEFLKPRHEVTLTKDFYISQTEVTQELWEAVMDTNPSHFHGAQLPVENVSWEDCDLFIAKLNEITGKKFRMPTEAEWEFAAKGGNRSMGYIYSGSNTIGEVAWFGQDDGHAYPDGNSGETTHPVAQKKANELGIYDMSGNVWEWCRDWFGKYPAEPQNNPLCNADFIGRVVRGGGYASMKEYCYTSERNFHEPTYHDRFVGLRLALDARP